MSRRAFIARFPVDCERAACAVVGFWPSTVSLPAVDPVDVNRPPAIDRENRTRRLAERVGAFQEAACPSILGHAIVPLKVALPAATTVKVDVPPTVRLPFVAPKFTCPLETLPRCTSLFDLDESIQRFASPLTVTSNEPVASLCGREHRLSPDTHARRGPARPADRVSKGVSSVPRAGGVAPPALAVFAAVDVPDIQCSERSTYVPSQP